MVIILHGTRSGNNITVIVWWYHWLVRGCYKRKRKVKKNGTPSTKTYRNGLWCKQPSQGLIKKQKVHTDCEKGVQSRTLANNIATQWWPNINTKESLNKLCIKIYFLDLQVFPKSSYEIGSVLPSFHLSVGFLRIGSLIFFWNLAWC